MFSWFPLLYDYPDLTLSQVNPFLFSSCNSCLLNSFTEFQILLCPRPQFSIYIIYLAFKNQFIFNLKVPFKSAINLWRRFNLSIAESGT